MADSIIGSAVCITCRATGRDAIIGVDDRDTGFSGTDGVAVPMPRLAAFGVYWLPQAGFGGREGPLGAEPIVEREEGATTLMFTPGDLWSDIVLAMLDTEGLSKVGRAGVASSGRVAANGVDMGVEEIVTQVEGSATSAFEPIDLGSHIGDATGPSVER